MKPHKPSASFWFLCSLPSLTAACRFEMWKTKYYQRCELMKIICCQKHSSLSILSDYTRYFVGFLAASALGAEIRYKFVRAECSTVFWQLSGGVFMLICKASVRWCVLKSPLETFCFLAKHAFSCALLSFSFSSFLKMAEEQNNVTLLHFVHLSCLI